SRTRSTFHRRSERVKATAFRCSSHATSTSGPCMTSVNNEASSLELTLRPLRPWLREAGVTELCINRPQELFVETRAGWRCESLPTADFDWCRRLAKLIANATRQRVDESSPL